MKEFSGKKEKYYRKKKSIECETADEIAWKKRQMEAFIEGLRRYQECGVPLLIDGRVSTILDCRKLFTAEKGAFYMGDFIDDECGRLKEIHFNKIRY